LTLHKVIQVKTKQLIAAAVIAAVVIVIIFSVGKAAKRPRSIDMTGLTYEQLCKSNDDQWMVMEPWKAGKQMGVEKCAGCMMADNHFCSAEEYVDYVKALPGSKVSSEKGSEMGAHNMGSMMVMRAHGGNQDAVGVHTYNVAFIRDKVTTDAALVFELSDLNSGEPISDLEIMHDKIIHLALVRNDLKHFDHVHPEEVRPGVYSVPYIFSAPGKYRLWIDFTKGGMQHIVDFDVGVTGLPQSTEPDRLSGLKVTMRPVGEVRVSKAVKTDFDVRSADGSKVPITEKFLSANAHLIEVDESLDEFEHAHDVRLIEPHHFRRHPFRILKKRSDDLLLVFCIYELHIVHIPTQRHLLSQWSMRNRMGATEIFVSARKIQKQIFDGAQSHAFQRTDVIGCRTQYFDERTAKMHG
jgi:hypothetical protein